MATRSITSAAAATVAALLSLPAFASADPGDLAYDGCLANDASQGCFDLPFAPLRGAEAVATSPDGQSVYVASTGSASVAHFRRTGERGQLTYAGCHANTTVNGCVDLQGDPLAGAAAVALSADGTSVYVASNVVGSIAHFFRDTTTGAIAYGGCVANTGHQGCADLPGEPLREVRDVAVSPDGKSVYAASGGADSIAHFFRAPAGQISYDGCLANTAADGCGPVPGAPLEGAQGVAVSPDGKSVYVTSAVGDSVAHFFRGGPDGQISYDGCLANTAANGCGDLPGSPLEIPSGVTVSPDGRSVYVAGAGSDAVAHFLRGGQDGQISYDGCVANTAEDGCAAVVGEPLDGTYDVAVSPDGMSVYVASILGGTIAHLRRSGANGQITYDGCLANTAAQGCVDLPQVPISFTTGVAISPGGESVYVSARGSDSVAHFFREPVPGPQPQGPQPQPGTPDPQPDPGTPDPQPDPGTRDPQPASDTVAPRISGLTVTRARFRIRTTFRYSLSEAARVTVTLERVRPGRSARRAGRLVRAGRAGSNALRFGGRIGARKLRPGVYRARFAATDAAGNRSRTATVRFRVIGRRSK